MSLYQKHRPRSFKTVVGNENTIAQLQKMTADKSKCPHAFLLTGPTGCGKTTIGRIIGKALGCGKKDIRELDTADFRGIDMVRELRQKTQYAPIEGEARLWILDECHELTPNAQDALLKQLEDPPKHVYFVLCTTNPEKLKPTLKGRCSTFDMKLLTEDQMTELLQRIAKKEKTELNGKVIEAIVENALGHPRNALTVLEQVLASEPEEQLKTAQETAEEQSQIIELCRALIKKTTWKRISTILSNIEDRDAERIRRTVLGYCQAVLLKGDNEIAGLIMEEFIDNFYDSGFPGVVYACYSICKS